MSTLLEQASLVMIPSGYKEDVVYSVIPESGAGDLSFTRASDGTRINSAGLVENMPYNLLQYSQTITNGVWQTQNTTKSLEAGTTPLNTPIYKVLATGSFAQFYESNILTVGLIYSDTVLVKKGNCRYIHFRHGNFSYYDFDTNTFSGSNASIMTASDLTNGWILIKTSGYASTFANFSIYQSNNTNPYGGANGDFTYVSFCQVNLGSTAKQYFATTNRQDVPRLNYQNGGGGCPSLLLEPQRTNLATYSEQFNNAAWTKSGGTATANSTTSPDGTQNADTFTENTANTVHTIYQPFSSITGNQYTFSCYVKENGRNIVRFECQATSVLYQVEFNLATGTTSNISGTGTAVITNIGNGWYRCSATITSTATGTGYWQLDLCSSAGVISYLGNGTSGVYIYGAQVEAGAYATSYIPTTSASATRVNDAFSRGNLYTNGIITSSGGTWFIQLKNNFAYTRDSASGIELASVGFTQRIILYNIGGVNRLSIFLTTGGLVYTTTTDDIKVAIKWNGSTATVYVNGVKVVNSATFTGLNMENLIGGQGVPFYIQQSLLFPLPLTDNELAQLTSL